MKKGLCLALAVCILASIFPAYMVFAADEKPAVINNTFLAKPGDALGVYGGNFGTDAKGITLMLMNLDSYKGEEAPTGDVYSLPVLNATDSLIQSVIPAEMKAGNFVGWVKTKAGFSNPFFVNTPRIDWVSENEIVPTMSARIFGRNFLNPKTGDFTDAKLILAQVGTDKGVEAEITAVSEYTVDFIVPEGIIAGEKYIPKYNNGASEYGWATGDEKEFVTARSMSKNYQYVKENYDLELGWAEFLNIDNVVNAKDEGLVGDGKTDDTKAFLALLNKMKTDAGILFFPAGTYNLKSLHEGMDGEKIINNVKAVIPNKTILVGEGDLKSILDLGEGISVDSQYGGMYNIYINCSTVRPEDDFKHDADGKPIIISSGVNVGLNEMVRRIGGFVGSIIAVSTNKDAHFFLKNVKTIVADGSSINSGYNNHIIIEDCHLDFTHQGPQISNKGGAKARITNNYIRNTQRSILWLNENSWAEGNELVGANAGSKCEGYGGAMEHRILESGGNEIYFAGNNITGFFGDVRPDRDDNSGEGICNQSQCRIVYSSVTSATKNTINDTRKDFDQILKGIDIEQYKDYGKRLIGAYIAIVYGKGIGQIRKVTAASGNTITIDKDWDIVPDATSVYTVDTNVTQRYIIADNNIEAECRKGGIMLYCKNADNMISGNITTKSGGIWFSKNQISEPSGVERNTHPRADFSFFNFVYNNDLSGGVVPKEVSERSNSLYIGPGTDGGANCNVDPYLPVTVQYGSIYKSNKIVGSGKDIQPLKSSNEMYMMYNGIIVSVPDTNTPSIKFPQAQGFIIEDNYVTNSRNGVTLSSTSFDTLLYKNNFVANGAGRDYYDLGSTNTTKILPTDKVPASTLLSMGRPTGIDPADMMPNPNIDTTVQQPKTFDDIIDHWAKDDIETLATQGIIKGVSDTEFAPELTITRAEFISLVVRGLGIDISVPYGSTFSDVSSDNWYAASVEQAYKSALIDDAMVENKNIKPEQQITREEMTSIIVKALEYSNVATKEADINKFSDAPTISPWAITYVKKAYESGIINGVSESEFAPLLTATRAESAAMIRRLFNKIR